MMEHALQAFRILRREDLEVKAVIVWKRQQEVRGGQSFRNGNGTMLFRSQPVPSPGLPSGAELLPMRLF